MEESNVGKKEAILNKRNACIVAAGVSVFGERQAHLVDLFQEAAKRCLNDIPEFFPALLRYHLPCYQYTARDVKTGFTLISYSYEHSQTNSVNFLIYVADRFSALGVNPKDCVVQTDNGKEFVAGWNSGKRSAFEKWVDALFAEHKTIPPGAKTYQSDVESFHRLIEDEFYRIESVSSKADFIRKAATYIVWFNWARRNYYKGGTPTAIWKGTPSTIPPALSPPPHLQYIFPIFLDEITPYILALGGYHVPLLDINNLFFYCTMLFKSFY